MFSTSFEIHELPKTTNAQASMHHMAKGKEVLRWHAMVWKVVGANKPKSPLLRAKLTLTRCSSSEPDYDGLVSSFKHVVDGLKRCGVLVDDKVSNIGQSQYIWKKAAPKKGKIIVMVKEIDASQVILPDVAPVCRHCGKELGFSA